MSDIEKGQDSILIPAKQANLQTVKNIGGCGSEEELNKLVDSALRSLAEEIQRRIERGMFHVSISEDEIRRNIKGRFSKKEESVIFRILTERIESCGYHVFVHKDPKKKYLEGIESYIFEISWDNV